MKVLESAPHRYDRGIKILTLGKINKAYDRIVETIKKEDTVLDIGCGTGMLSYRAVLKGADVTGIDINSEMLDIAEKRAHNMELKIQPTFIEMGVAELNNFEAHSYDVVMSGLCFSELSDDEIKFTLKNIKRILKKEGVFLLIDEVKSKSIFKRFLNIFIRIPLIIITYILTQTTTKALTNIEERINKAGLMIESRRFNFLDNFIELHIVKEVKE